MEKKTTAFVLSGGGAAGAWQVGALRAFVQAGILPDFITANSAGSLNAVGFSYAGIQKLEAMWRSIRERADIFRKNWPLWTSILLNRESLFDSTPLRKKIAIMMNEGPPLYPVCVNTVSLKSGRLRRVWNTEFGFQDFVLASASIPLVAPPVQGEWVDGGIRENSPLRPALERGAKRIFLFLNAPKNKLQPLPPVSKVSGLKQIGARTLGVLMDEAFWEDIALNEADKDLELFLIQPEHDYMDTMDFDQMKIANAIEKGFQEANIAISEIRKRVQLG